MIKIIAPATSANLGPGFDVFGIALEQPFDVMKFRERSEGIKIMVEGFEVPTSPKENVAGIVASAVLKKFDIKAGVEISLEKKIRPKSGLGSSAASAAGTAFGLCKLFNLPLSKLELVKLSLLGEKFTSGVTHADNTAACIYGGFTIASYNPLSVITLKMPENLEYAIALPEIEISTKEAREILPKKINFENAVSNTSNAASFIAGICKKDIALIGRSMRDEIVEPIRKKQVPFYGEVKKAALAAGASGAAISGSGPAIVALCDSEKVDSDGVAEGMGKICKKHGIKCDIFSGKIGRGVRLNLP
ncbi:MAG: homoserine kinase [Candidatus Hydrothermarchaeota archaeon]|nr:homoserine kinase [Candidatus Hydrothermarchaeota archaeon]